MSSTRLAFLAPVTTHVFNPFTRLFAGVLPGLGLVTHVGRRTGRRYQTPVLVSRRGDLYEVALWYGSDAQWVKNVRAAGGCALRVGGKEVRVTEPELFTGPALSTLVGQAGRFVGLTEALRMHERLP
jgi:deazaflavin-dependent oxidoreductase (nitroreductase family)